MRWDVVGYVGLSVAWLVLAIKIWRRPTEISAAMQAAKRANLRADQHMRMADKARESAAKDRTDLIVQTGRADGLLTEVAERGTQIAWLEQHVDEQAVQIAALQSDLVDAEKRANRLQRDTDYWHD